MRRFPIPDPRRSFAAKLSLGVLAAVGLLLGVMLLVVRMETSAQVTFVAESAVDQAREAFAESEERRKEQLARRAASFADSRRTTALIEGAIEADDIDYIVGQLSYQLNLGQFEANSLTALTTPFGEPIVTLVGETVMKGRDPARIAPLVRDLLDGDESDVTAYRVLDDRLYTIRVVLLQLAGRVVGAIAFGLPIVDADAEALGRLVGAEACFVVDGRCVAATPRARDDLSNALTAAHDDRSRRVTDRQGNPWEVLADPLPEAEDEGSLAMAVPLEAVLAPFNRIKRALAIGSIGSLILAIMVSVILSRALTRPVNALVEGTQRVARGDYEVQVPDGARDEIGQLARSFNAMTRGLRLKEYYRGVLDKVVSRDVAEELLQGEIRLGGESREVSVLFADMRGFTAMTEGMAPQAIIGLLNETMEQLSAAVDHAGGVVDKFVGDEIMAVFGAPLAQAEHADRAVAAAVAMQRAIAAMNDERLSRGKSPVDIGVGINTGVVIAGNMGSQTRLNYTVVGEAVNLASRLCSAAAAGEIIISDATQNRLSTDFQVEPVPDRQLKGFSRPVSLYAVRAEIRRSNAGNPRGGVSAAFIILALALSLAASGPSRPTAAQALPTLSELGIGYLSSDGQIQLDFSGRADLEGYLPSQSPSWIIPDTEPFVAGRLRLFTDLFLGDYLFASAEVRVDRGPEPTAGPVDVRLEQIFLRVEPSFPAFVQAGRFVSSIGGYPSRHHTRDDPLIRPPLMYEYRTMVSSRAVPGNTAAFMQWKDNPAEFRPAGAPPVWGAPYPWGAAIGLFVRDLSARVALVNSAPSSEPDQWRLRRNSFDRPTWQVAASYRLRPELRVRAFHSRGPYLEEAATGAFPADASVADYDQVIWGGELALRRGYTALRIEAMHDRWQVPNLVDDPIDVSYYVEARQRLTHSLAVATRFSAMHFNRIRVVEGGELGTEAIAMEKWDYGARRIQIGASYRLLGNVEVRAEQAWNWTAAPHDENASLTSLQMWWTF